MRLCKKCAAVTAFVLLFCALIPLTVLGHSGRTDSRGGHYDHQMGMYHYHHGFPAHGHSDGVCPFDPNYEKNLERPQEWITPIPGMRKKRRKKVQKICCRLVNLAVLWYIRDRFISIDKISAPCRDASSFGPIILYSFASCICDHCAYHLVFQVTIFSLLRPLAWGIFMRFCRFLHRSRKGIQKAS